MKSIDKLVKSLFVAAGIGAGIMGFSAKANAQCPGPFVSDDNTIALWHFDENSGTVTIGDTKGYNGYLHATIFGQFPNSASDLWSEGMFGSSGLKFHPPSSFALNDLVVVLPFESTLTIEAYINPETLVPVEPGGQQCFVAYNEVRFGLNEDEKLFLRVRSPTTAPPYYSIDEYLGERTIETGKFSYVGFTFNGSNELNFYVNGSLDKHFNISSVIPRGPLYQAFGSAGKDAQNNSIAQFSGTIDEVRISDNVRNFTPCSITTSVLPTTWGKLKSIYR